MTHIRTSEVIWTLLYRQSSLSGKIAVANNFQWNTTRHSMAIKGFCVSIFLRFLAIRSTSWPQPALSADFLSRSSNQVQQYPFLLPRIFLSSRQPGYEAQGRRCSSPPETRSEALGSNNSNNSQISRRRCKKGRHQHIRQYTIKFTYPTDRCLWKNNYNWIDTNYLLVVETKMRAQ